MLRVKVLGPGCENCAHLKATAQEALEALGAEATLEYVTDRAEFAKYNLMMTPGLVVNEKLVSAGRVPATHEVITLFANVLAAEEAGS
jgi:small redox-active disulfide protein 2